jgi:small subunit ribosomal protein S1
MLKVGQEVDVKVLEIDPGKEKISFGIKQLQSNPYESYSRGRHVMVTIKEITDAGAVVEIEPGMEGFVPRSEITMDRAENPTELISVGEKTEATVISVDLRERNITLSIRQHEIKAQRAAERKYSTPAPRPKLGDLFEP